MGPRGGSMDRDPPAGGHRVAQRRGHFQTQEVTTGFEGRDVQVNGPEEGHGLIRAVFRPGESEAREPKRGRPRAKSVSSGIPYAATTKSSPSRRSTAIWARPSAMRGGGSERWSYVVADPEEPKPHLAGRRDPSPQQRAATGLGLRGARVQPHPNHPPRLDRMGNAPVLGLLRIHGFSGPGEGPDGSQVRSLSDRQSLPTYSSHRSPMRPRPLGRSLRLRASRSLWARRAPSCRRLESGWDWQPPRGRGVRSADPTTVMAQRSQRPERTGGYLNWPGWIRTTTAGSKVRKTLRNQCFRADSVDNQGTE